MCIRDRFYPVTILPTVVRYIAILIPLTISLQDMRAILLNLDYIFNPYLDLFLLLIYCALWPIMGFITFRYTIKKSKMEGGLGAY